MGLDFLQWIQRYWAGCHLLGLYVGLTKVIHCRSPHFDNLAVLAHYLSLPIQI